MEEEVYLDLKDLLYIIKKRLLMIVIITLIAAIASACVSYFVLVPQYQAKVSIIVSKDQGAVLTQSDVMMYQDLIKTYTQIAQSRSVAQSALSYMNSNLSVDDMLKGYTVTGESGTQVLTMTMTSTSPQLSVQKVEALAQAFVDQSTKLLPSGTVKIMDHAQTPTAPIKPNKKLNIAIAFAIGLMASIGLAILLDYMGDSIKSEEDVERYFGIPVIGIIPKHI